jgi:hypothetical protein
MTIIAVSLMAAATPTPAPTPSPDGQGLWGDVTCDQSAAGCDLDAGSRPSASTVPRSTASAKPTAPSASSQPICSTYPDVTGGLRDYWVLHHGLQPNQRLILRYCEPGGPNFIVLGPRGGANEPAVPDPAVRAASARDRLKLLAPGLGISPVGDQLVGLPMWLWIDRGSWRSVSASTAVPGVTTTATATPSSVTWSTGDGNTFTCQGAGAVYTAATPPGAASPDCGYVFRSPSPPEGFRLTATVHWSVSWQGAGRAGVFPDLVSTAAVTVHVLRVPAVNVLPGGGQ